MNEKEFLSNIMNYSYYNDKGELCVVLNLNILKELYNALKENKIYVDELYSYDGNIEFDINDGDWKHEHIKAKNFIYDFFIFYMTYFFL